MTPWVGLIRNAGAITAKLEALRPPLFRVEVDGEVVLWGLARPSAAALQAHANFWATSPLTPERWLIDVLEKLAHNYPHPDQEVELYALWPGDPPRLERVAASRKREAVAA